MSFSNDIKKFSKKTGMRLEEASRGLKIKLFTGVIVYTRVDTGRLRGNWQTSTGQPKYAVIDRNDKIVKGATGGYAYEEVFRNIQAFSVDYLTNNLPYASVWEERDGMISKTVQRINGNLKKAIA